VTGVRQRIFRNGAAGIFGFAVTAGSQLLTVPVFISGWGKVRYGEWLVLTSIPAYFIFSDVGFGQVGSNKMAMLEAEGKESEVQSVLHTMWLFQTLLGLAMLGLGAVLFLALPWANWLALHGMEPRRVGQVLLGLLAYVLLNMQAQPYSAIYRSCGQMARFLTIASTSRLLELLLTLALVWLKGREAQVVLGMVALRCLTLAFYHRDTRGRFPNLSVGFRHFSRAHFFSLFKPGVGHFGIGIAQAFQLQGMLLVINRLIGAEAVAIYSIARTLTRIPLQCVVLINGAIYPEFSGLIVSGGLAKARDIHRIMLQLSLWISIAVAVFVLTAGPHVITIWTLGKINVTHALLAALNLSIIMNLAWFSSSVVLSSVNRHATLGVLYIVSAGAALVVGCILAKLWGIVGPALASGAAEAVVAFYVLPRACAAVGDTVPGALADAMRLSTLRRHLAVLYVRVSRPPTQA
jgi:O-antigen/teichoic acid export membrane protein